MAFGFGFGLQFGSRGGGGGGAAPLAAAQLRTDLAALGFTVTRSGVRQSHTLDAGLGFESISANVAAFERVTIGSRQHLGLISFPGSTPLVADSNNLTGWSVTGAPSVVYTASGGLDGAGYTTITGTGSAWTVSKALTDASGNRTSRVRYGSASGTVTLSQDGGSTTTAATTGSIKDVALPAQTSSNPTLRVAGGASDSIIIYDFQHGKPASGAPAYKWYVPQGVTPAAVGADTIIRTLPAPPASIDFEILFRTGGGETATMVALALGNSGSGGTERLIIDWIPGSGGQVRIYTKSSGNLVATRAAGVLVLVRVRWTGTAFTYNFDNGSDNNATIETLALQDFARIGHRATGDHFFAPIVSMRDRVGTVLGAAGTIYNAPALADYEASLP